MATANLTRAEMEAVIDAGGSVLHDRQVITRREDLPSEADLAAGDPDKSQEVADKLKAQIADLKEQLAQAQTQQKEAADVARAALEQAHAAESTPPATPPAA